MRLRDFFEALTRQQPLLLILEDLHWADDLSLDLIALLMDTLVTTPLMLVCVYRPEREHRAWQLGTLAQRKCLDRTTEIPLKQLSHRESRQLVESLLTIDDLPESVKALILQKSEGNPFFIEEVIRSLIDRDLVYRDGERWKARAEVSAIDVPDTIQSVVLARVDRLEAEAKAVLQCAAVIGRLFKYRLLEQIAHQERELARHLGEFAERDLVYEERSVPELEYAFWHALTQEATYQSILERRRREYHLRVGSAMEHLYHDRLEEYYEELAHHYSRSDETWKAVEYLYKAGEKAKRASANEAASGYFSGALDLLATLPDDPERARQELNVQIGLGGLLVAVKGFAAPEIEQVYDRARELCEQVGETAKLFSAVRGLWLYHLARGQHPMERILAEQLLELAHRLADSAVLLEAHRALGTTLVFLGEFLRAEEHLEQGMALYSLEQHRTLAFVHGIDSGVMCLSYSAITLWVLGRPDQALERSQEAVRLARETGHPFSLAQALYFAAWLHSLRREAAAAQEHAEAAITLAEEQGFPLSVALATCVRGWALAEQGRREEGMHQMCQALNAYLATGAEQGRAHFHALQAEQHQKAGQIEQGLARVAEALMVVEKCEARLYEAELHRLHGELLLARSASNCADAERCFQQALAIARRQSAKSWELRAATSLARLWQRQDKREEAREMLAAIYGWFTEGFETADLKEARALLDELS